MRGFLGSDGRLAGVRASQLLVGDLNRDGRDDLLMTGGFGGVRGSGQIYHQGASGLSATPTERVLLGAGTDTLAFLDLDGDGGRDVSFLSAHSGWRAYLGRAQAGRLKLDQSSPLTGVWMSTTDRNTAAYGDFNNDGVPDLAVAAGYDGLVVFHGSVIPDDPAIPVPAAPGKPVATGNDWSTTVGLGFPPSAHPGGAPILRYEVEPDPWGGIGDLEATSNPTAVNRSLVNHLNDTPYRYRVRALNAGGAGPWSSWSDPYRVRKIPHLSVSVQDVFETDGAVRFVFRLNEGPALSGGVTFDVATQDISALAGGDYQAVAITGVTIPQGQQEVVVEVPLIADDVAEGYEYFRLLVSNVQGATWTAGLNIQAGIRNDPVVSLTPNLYFNWYQVVEGNFGGQVMRFRLELSRPTNLPVSFDLATTTGTATPGVDYLPRSLAGVTIPPGETQFFFDVQMMADLVPEEDEYFRIDVTNVVNAWNADVRAFGIIIDDDTNVAGVPAVHEVASEKGRVDLDFDFLPEGALRFSGTALVKTDVRQALVGQDPTPGEAFDNLAAGTVTMNTRVPANPSGQAVEMRLLVIAESATARRLALQVGRGSAPTLGSTSCLAHVGTQGLVCEIVLLRPPGAKAEDFWVLAQNLEAGGTGIDAVRLEAGAVTMVTRNDDFFASGARRSGDRPYEVRLGWDSPGFEPGERRLGYLIAENRPGLVVYHEPIRLHRTGLQDAAHVLAPGQARRVYLAPGEAQDRLVVDVPANAGGVVFSTEGEGEISFYASHVARPDGPGIGPAPPRGQAQASAHAPGANQVILLEGDSLRPGHWYLTPVNIGSTPAAVSVRADVVSEAPRPDFRPGHYFNPERPGHGLFLDFAGDQWVMVWYTYLQDGTPTWYYSQGPSPAVDQAQWTVDLMRVTRPFGAPTVAVAAGSATLTILPGPATSSPKLAFGYNLDGDAGWETLTRLGDDRCPMWNGQPLDASGHWYAPANNGAGMSAQLLPNTEVHAVYDYDFAGYPRWLIGQKDFDPAAQAVTLQQLAGFCPTCAVRPVTSQPVGVLLRTFAASSHNDGLPGIGSAVIRAEFAPPLLGVVSQAAPVYLLSARKGCQ
jgi:hypothetical protein